MGHIAQGLGGQGNDLDFDLKGGGSLEGCGEDGET